MVDVIVPGAWSSDGLATALASLASQRYPAFRVAAARPPNDDGGSSVRGIAAVLEARGHAVTLHDLSTGPTAGHRRQALLELATAPYVLLVDDGIYLEPDLLGRLVAAIRSTRCGVIGSAVVDLRYRHEHHPEEQAIEFWDGPVRAEDVQPGTRAWSRRHLHRGANLEHLRERLPRTRDRLYRIADIQGCVLYDRAELVAIGGFSGPGEREQARPLSLEAAAQLRVLGRSGGAGLFPSGAYRIVPGQAPQDSSWEASREVADVLPRVRGATRWIRSGHRWRHGLAAHLRRGPAHRQIRAPGLLHRRSTTRPAGGPLGS